MLPMCSGEEVLRRSWDGLALIYYQHASAQQAQKEEAFSLRESLFGCFLAETIHQCPDAFNGGFNDITWFQPDLFVFRITKDDPIRCAGEDDVAGFQRKVLGDVGNDCRDVENEMLRVAVLANLAVQLEGNIKMGRIELIGSHIDRSERRKFVR